MSDKDLRAKVVRLAHQKPELRKHLLPLLSDKVSSTDPIIIAIGKVVEKLGYSINPKYRMHGYYVGEFEGVSMNITVSKRSDTYEIGVMNENTRMGLGERIRMPTSDRKIVSLIFKLTKELV